MRILSRRQVLQSATAAALSAVLPASSATADEITDRITDSEIHAGVRAAIEKNLIPAATQKQYPGHFTINADGGWYGADSTWPGLDSWQMAGAYLLLGRRQLVQDYFAFVRASQRKDGNIPFAIFPGTTRPDTTWLRGLKYPDDLFTYTPPHRDGVPASALAARQWIGMFSHWQPKANPLSTLGATCYLLTAAEIFDATRSEDWLRDNLESIEAAAKHLLTRKSDNGLIAGSGFYTELPPRYGWDGVTQCYIVHAFRELARISRNQTWTRHADELAARFTQIFWQNDHFAEYVHAERGLVDLHGLSDVNWAAIAFGIATDDRLKKLWPRMMNEPGFWAGDIPTQSVTKPHAYQPWEYHETLPFGAPTLKDVAAMGRVWYLETLACVRMNDRARLIESTKKVCRAAKDGYWVERYQEQPNRKVVAVGAPKYCEYPAVLIRTVLGNPKVFIP
jgi:hypothetical protein